MSTMAMAPCDGDADWCRVLGNLLLYSSSTPHAMASSRAEDCLPTAAAPPGVGPGGGHLPRCKNQALEAPSDGVFAAADCLSLSSALMNLQGEDESLYMPMYSAPPPAVVIGDQYQLPPLPAVDGALTSLDDALLLPFSDIDLEAFDNNADEVEHKPPPVRVDDRMIMIPPAVHHHHPAAADEHKPPPVQMTMIPPAVHHHHAPAAATARTPPTHGTTVVQNAGVVVVHAHQKKAVLAGIDDSCFRRGGGASSGVEMRDLVRHHHDEHRQAISSAAVALVPPPQKQPPPPPPSLPPRPRARRSGGGDRRSTPPAAGKTTRLDHIGFDELRKYFDMPITRAAREMNVGLTVLKKRCRELGVARWPHRKMKSLKSLMANVQEMGNGMSPVALQQELAALETYCALMEEQPWMELTDRTKKLRQACFKESYKRRRAAAVVSVMEMDHIYSSFGQQHGHCHQQLPPPPTSIAADDRHGQQQSSRFFAGY